MTQRQPASVQEQPLRDAAEQERAEQQKFSAEPPPFSHEVTQRPPEQCTPGAHADAPLHAIEASAAFVVTPLLQELAFSQRTSTEGAVAVTSD